MLEHASRDMGYCSDSIAISRDVGPLSRRSSGPPLQESTEHPAGHLQRYGAYKFFFWLFRFSRQEPARERSGFFLPLVLAIAHKRLPNAFQNRVSSRGYRKHVRAFRRSLAKVKPCFGEPPCFFLQTFVCLLNIQCVQRPLPASGCRSRPPSPTQH